MKPDPRAYFLHRTGALVGVVGASLWAAFSFENRSYLNESIGRASFFWSLGLILITGPLILGLTRRDSLRFLVLELSLFGTHGALALVLPADVLPRVTSIITIAALLGLIVLRRIRRDSHILDIKAGISPSLVAESLAIVAVSWVFAFALQSLMTVPGLTATLSTISRLLLLWGAFFALFSAVMVVVRTVWKPRLQNVTSARM